VSASTAYHNRSISPQEQLLYNHWLARAEQDTPEQLIERFQTLFIRGAGYPEREVVAALDEIVSSREIDEYFHYILNRCCHILVNRWQSRPQLQTSIPELIRIFEEDLIRSSTEYCRSRQMRNLHRVVSRFTETEQYLALKRLARILERVEVPDCDENLPLGNLIQRYPYLYEHCLLDDESTEEHQKSIRRIQIQAQQQFEVNLSHYVTYRVRQARAKKQGSTSDRMDSFRPIANPTLLSDRELVTSINQFSGKVDNGRTYKDSAKLFLEQNKTACFSDFKRDLYDYLTSTIHPAYGNQKFNKVLAQHLSQTLPQNNHQALNDFLVVRTCSQLLNLLVVESSTSPQHFIFVDLINNLGPVLTASLLLKLVLLCKKVKPYLEKRFSILFNHYETATQSSVEWLVKMLENINVGFSLAFGSIDIALMMSY
jgi:hypothetical protein